MHTHTHTHTPSNSALPSPALQYQLDHAHGGVGCGGRPGVVLDKDGSTPWRWDEWHHINVNRMVHGAGVHRVLHLPWSSHGSPYLTVR